jgi:hypothetical protein
MTSVAWKQFVRARNHYRRETDKLSLSVPGLRAIQQKLVNSRSPSYTVETPIVYNNALDDVNADSEIRLILVADNPGRREQAAENRRYLVGPSGKIAEKFFRDKPELGIDFRRNVIILNKTPIHTPRTVELRELCRLGGDVVETALENSQRLMARLLLEFHESLNQGRSIQVWITGYSEMKKNGVFAAYTEELKTLYGNSNLKGSIFLYRHFSMNQFTIDLKQQTAPNESLTATLKRIGTAYRERFLFGIKNEDDQRMNTNKDERHE